MTFNKVPDMLIESIKGTLIERMDIQITELTAERAAMAKLTATTLQNKLLDEFLQLHGGYGYMWEYPIARAFADARVHRIYGGSNEIMRELIARTL